MKVPWRTVKTRLCDTRDGGVKTPTAAQQIAELQVELKRVYSVDDGDATSTTTQQILDLEAELERCKREKLERGERHDQVVRDLKTSYSDAFEWAYSVKARPQYQVHWLGKGHTDEYVDAIESLLNTFKRIVKELRTGSVGARISVKFELQDDGHRVTAAHDYMLMPYWKELANALVHWSEYHAGKETLEISIICIETPDAVLDVLRPALKRSRVKYVGFVNDGTPKSWTLAEFIGDIIRTNHGVTSVGFGKVVLSNEEWKAICNAIRTRNVEQTSIMDYFKLTECFGGGMSDEALKDILTSNAVEVGLESNGLSSREVPVIAQHLNSNSSLARLYLCGNLFNDKDAAALANALSSNTNLRVLSIEQNSIG
ncbi:hypothetical protein THAOC_06516, partial [Thalassiosira oceanica]